MDLVFYIYHLIVIVIFYHNYTVHSTSITFTNFFQEGMNLPRDPAED